jgi:hypothetical protein
MPLDKLEITTNLKLKVNYTDFIDDNAPNIRFNGTGDPMQSNTRRLYTNIDMGPVSICVLTDASVSANPMLIWIRFNPSGMLAGHNGYLLTARDVLVAFTKLADKLAPMLADRHDKLKLIPGIVPTSPSYWNSLEIPAHLPDGDGSIFNAICNARHDSVNSKPYLIVGDSIKMKSRRGGVGISAYFKDFQMKDLLRRQSVPESKKVLRVEALLSNDKLVEYFRTHGITRSIGGKDRLVSFRPAAVIAAHRKVMEGMKGFFYAYPKEASGDAKFIAAIVREHNIPLDVLLAARNRAMKQSERNMKKVARECRNTLAASSQLELHEVFSDEAYGIGRSVSSPQSALQYERSEDGTIDPDILRVYGPKV